MTNVDKQFEDAIKVSKERINSKTDDTDKAVRSLVEVGLYLKDISKASFTNDFRSKINKTVDEFLEIGKVKDFLANIYFKGATEYDFAKVDMAKVYEEAQKDLVKYEGNESLIYWVLGRTYAIHKYYEKYETPKARIVYFRVIAD